MQTIFNTNSPVDNVSVSSEIDTVTEIEDVWVIDQV